MSGPVLGTLCTCLIQSLEQLYEMLYYLEDGLSCRNTACKITVVQGLAWCLESVRDPGPSTVFFFAILNM